MRILVSRDPYNEAVKVFTALANPIRKRSLRLALAALNPAESSIVLCDRDPRGFPPDELKPFNAYPLCRVFLAPSAMIDHGLDYIRWLHRGATDILLPGMTEGRLKERMQWAIDYLPEPSPGRLMPIPPLGDVYLLTAYARRQLDTMEKWVQPALYHAGYQGLLVRESHGLSIRHAENDMAQTCTFAIAHLGKDGRRPGAPDNTRVSAEIRTLVNHAKLVIGIRPSSERDLQLPGDLRDINCHHFDSDPELPRGA